MKNQAIFSSKDKSNNLKCHLLQFSFGPLRVKLSLLSLLIWRTDKCLMQGKNSEVYLLYRYSEHPS